MSEQGLKYLEKLAGGHPVSVIDRPDRSDPANNLFEVKVGPLTRRIENPSKEPYMDVIAAVKSMAWELSGVHS